MLAILAQLMLLVYPFWPNAVAETNHEELFDRITVHYSSDNFDSVTHLSEIALLNSRQTGNYYEQGRSLFFLGAVADRENKPDKSIPFLLESLESFSHLDTEKSYSYQSEICISLGKIFRQHGAFSEALDIYKQGMSYALMANNTEALRKLLYNQSVAYRRQGNALKAIEALTQSIELIPEGDHSKLLRSYNQFGAIYHELGNYSSARFWYDKMLALQGEDSMPQYFRAQANHNIALTYKMEKEYATAWSFFEMTLAEKEKLGNTDKLFLTYQDMAELAFIEEKHELARSFAQEALGLMDQVANTPDYYKIYKLLAQIEEKASPSVAMIYANKFMEASEAFTSKQKELLENGDRYKIQLITSTYFNNAKRETERVKFAWSISCSVVFVFLVVALTFKLYRIYRYRSPKLALSHIKSHNELVFLLDLFRKEKEEMRNTLKQSK